MTTVLQVVDSSGWIEVFTNGPQAESFIEVLEVFKWILCEHSEKYATQALPKLLELQLANLQPAILHCRQLWQG